MTAQITPSHSQPHDIDIDKTPDHRHHHGAPDNDPDRQQSAGHANRDGHWQWTDFDWAEFVSDGGDLADDGSEPHLIWDTRHQTGRDSKR